MSLRELPVLFLDCQTTATQPASGDVIELGWAVGCAGTETDATIRSSLIRLPEGRFVSSTVRRITGLTESDFADAPDAPEVWARLCADLAALPSPRPTVIHYARFELPFLAALQARVGCAPEPFDAVCTYHIAKMLIPGLPSSTLRAVSGHFGRVLGEQHRAQDHVRATAWIWRHLVGALAREGITEWTALGEWLKTKPATRRAKARRTYLLPAEKRLSLPDQPGVYRMLSGDGVPIYVGKATSLKDRVNSYFRGRTRTRARIPELMAQVHDIDVTPVETPLEAALLETDEIKRWNPPYNASLRSRNKTLTFWSSDLTRFQARPDDEFRVGPFASQHVLKPLTALAELLVTGEDPYGVLMHIEDAPTIAEGARLFQQKHGLRPGIYASVPELLNLGARLPPREEDPERDEEEERVYLPEDALASLENVLRRAAQQAQRARWLLRLSESALSWRHRDDARRLLRFESGRLVEAEDLPAEREAPVPARWEKGRVERQADFDVGTFDRMAVLYAEIRRLLTEGRAVELRLSPSVRYGAEALRRHLL